MFLSKSEFREALELGLKLADKVKAKPLVAADPDADRMGAAIPHNGDYVLLSGNGWVSCLWTGSLPWLKSGETPG